MTLADNNLTLNDFVTEINEDNNKFLNNYSIYERGKKAIFFVCLMKGALIIGFGRMGISHASLYRLHPQNRKK